MPRSRSDVRILAHFDPDGHRPEGVGIGPGSDWGSGDCPPPCATTAPNRPCLFCGARSSVLSPNDVPADTGRLRVQCTNPGCSVERAEAVLKRDGLLWGQHASGRRSAGGAAPHACGSADSSAPAGRTAHLSYGRLSGACRWRRPATDAAFGAASLGRQSLERNEWPCGRNTGSVLIVSACRRFRSAPRAVCVYQNQRVSIKAFKYRSVTCRCTSEATGAPALLHHFPRPRERCNLRVHSAAGRVESHPKELLTRLWMALYRPVGEPPPVGFIDDINRPDMHLSAARNPP